MGLREQRYLELLDLQQRARAIKEKRDITWGQVRGEIFRSGYTDIFSFSMASAMSPTHPSASTRIRKAIRFWIELNEKDNLSYTA